MSQSATEDERFWSKVDKNSSEDGCWLWTAAKSRTGYGRFYGANTNSVAHRVAYAKVIGPIPEGFQIDHLCLVTSCVNPEHLEAVEPAVNERRAFRAYGMGYRVKS